MDAYLGVARNTQAAVYNALRLDLPSIDRWEIQLLPASGWEIRNTSNVCCVMDSRIVKDKPEIEGETVAGIGKVVAYYQGTRGKGSYYRLWSAGEPDLTSELGEPGNSIADQFPQLAEAFVYNEITTSVGGNPEHEVVYVNCIQPQTVPADYDNLALVGMNIRAGREFGNLSQFSVYMNEGLGGYDFPSVLGDLLTNNRYGTGEIVSPEQIDGTSFANATAWTRNRRYFFDGVIDSPINLRQWGSDVARNFLLDFVVRNGKFRSSPLSNSTVLNQSPDYLPRATSSRTAWSSTTSTKSSASHPAYP